MPGPLEGIRVFDAGHAGVGAWAGMVLGGLGADVIKVEPPTLDINVLNPPRQKGLSVTYLVNNANKRSIILDLKDPARKELAGALIKTCDVFIENYRPGVIEKLGLGYEGAAQLNPRLIYASASAYPPDGAWGTRGAIDPLIQCVSGFASINGAEGGEPELLRQFGHIDHTVAWYLVAGIIRALLARAVTGQGCRVDVTMLRGALCLQTSRIASYLTAGEASRPMGSACDSTAPHQAFLCQDGRYIAVGVVQETQWHPFCKAMEMEELATDPRFETNAKRSQHRSNLVPILEARFRTKPLRWWEIRLTEVGVPNGRFMDMDVLLENAHILENTAVQLVQTRHNGAIYSGRIPLRFSESPLPETRGSGRPGEFTQAVLDELHSDIRS